ncbi:MAG: hypothetical protein JW726_15105 [Anaerolineales bacterium]|nr:hypothetical protein [Anaerolineales bacterium]
MFRRIFRRGTKFLSRHASVHQIRPETLTTVTSQVDDSPGWQSISGRAHDRDWGSIQELYTDSLTAWRKNPLAWRIIATTTNYVIGTELTITAPNRRLNKFIREFWYHRKNHMDLRLESMCDELSRAGDLFVLLFRNTADGMSYIRFVTKDQVRHIETALNDWETELSYEISTDDPTKPEIYLSPDHPGADEADAIMLHYAVNKPLGALMGESDLTTIIPWLLRYSRMLEDRVRLHWAARAFLYLVTVPSTKVEGKTQQYSAAPDSGSIIVKDESETWETINPSLRGIDSAPDLKAVRQLIDAGSGFPPHWRGEGGDVNVATAEAMQAPPERFLMTRQKYFIWMLEDILWNAFQRSLSGATVYGPAFAGSEPIYDQVFNVQKADVSTRDNLSLAQASKEISQALSSLVAALPSASPALQEAITSLVLKFAGEPTDPAEIAALLVDLPSPSSSSEEGKGEGNPGDNK